MKEFSRNKALQVFSYLNRRGFWDQDKVSLLLYFAERYSLRTFGPSILGDQFFLTDKGPVLLEVFNLLSSKDYPFLEGEDLMSEEDLESLEFSLGNFGSLSLEDLAKVSKLYPEAYLREKTLEESSSHGVEMIERDFLLNPTEKISRDIEGILGRPDPYKKKETPS